MRYIIILNLYNNHNTKLTSATEKRFTINLFNTLHLIIPIKISGNISEIAVKLGADMFITFSPIKLYVWVTSLI